MALPTDASAGCVNGEVEVFRRSAVLGGGSIWQPVQTLASVHPPGNGSNAHRFGSRVALHATESGSVRVAVGEPGYQSGQGAAHLFRRAAGANAFTLEASRTPPGGPIANDHFGSSVAPGPVDWFFGSHRPDEEGSVIAFHFSGAQWNNSIEIVAPAGLAQQLSFFGRAIATSRSGVLGDVWVGRPRPHEPGVDERGRVYRFQRIGGLPSPQPLAYVLVSQWEAAQVGIFNDEAELGWSLAVDGASCTALAGAPGAEIPELWGEVIVFGADRILANGFGCRAGYPGC